MKYARTLPRLKLDTAQILNKADSRRDLVTMPSSMAGVGYVTDGIDALVITTQGGYLRINAKKLPELIEELQWLGEEIERRSRD